MPNYRCTIPQGSIDFARRQQIARAFTDIHCGSTGAPRSFVHVSFWETEPGAAAAFATPYYVDGANRAGRPQAVKEQLLADLTAAFASIAGVPPGQVSGRITENPASWTMEGGFVLPEPGQEGPEWYAAAEADQAETAVAAD